MHFNSRQVERTCARAFRDHCQYVFFNLAFAVVNFASLELMGKREGSRTNRLSETPETASKSSPCDTFH